MTRVVKVGGRMQQEPALATTIAALWHHGTHPMVIVHGGGSAVTDLQRAFGVEARFEGGRRITTAQDVELVRMALSGVANKQLVSALVGEGVRAVGISGEDDGLIGAAPMDAERLGHVGEVTTVRPKLLLDLIAAGCLPVVSPVSRNTSATLGSALNVNGDDAAAVVAIALDASELVMVSDVAGVLVDGGVVDALSTDDARALIADGTAVKGMSAKLEAAIVALEGGVSRVRICDLAGLEDACRGTTMSLGRSAERTSVAGRRTISAVGLAAGGM